MTRSPEFADLIVERTVLVCCGPGGVGKTTTAAGAAVAGAISGRRTCVVTVDPARRLADALAHDGLTNNPEPIEGDWSGTLHAVALDPKATFDELVRQYAADDEQVERILANRLYRDLVTSLSGTQEYMATELHQLVHGDRFDLVVVDTPPSRNALELLAAPERLAGFLDNRIMRLLLNRGKPGWRPAEMAGEFVLRSLSRVAGSAIVDDTVAFFRAFSGMEVGFRARADEIAATLASPATAYVLVTSPRPESVREIHHFAATLEERGLQVAGAVVNRIQPDPGPMPSFDPPDRSIDARAWSSLMTSFADASASRAGETEAIDEVRRIVGDAPLVTLPLAPADIHDLVGLEDVARRLLAGTVR